MLYTQKELTQSSIKEEYFSLTLLGIKVMILQIMKAKKLKSSTREPRLAAFSCFVTALQFKHKTLLRRLLTAEI